jgi:hypothetical protein
VKALQVLVVVLALVLLMAWCGVCMFGALKLAGLAGTGPLFGLVMISSAFAGLGFALWSASKLFR